jgi:hypothetical protein
VTKQARAGLGALALAAALASPALAATPKPAITSFTPTTSNVGATIIISGKHLSGTTAVVFGRIKAQTFRIVSATRVTAIVPPSAKTGKITVITKGGSATSTASLKL